MELTKENLQEWKEILHKEMLRQYGIYGYDTTYSDEGWLTDCLGMTPQEVIDGEVECWEP